MAGIYKPTYTERRTVRDANGKIVMERKIATKGKNKGKEIEVKKQEPVLDEHGKPVLKKNKKWYIEYRDANDVLKRVPGYADKRATEQLAARLEREAAQRKEGVIDRFADHRNKPLGEHLEDWRKDLLAKGTTEKQAKLVYSRAGRIIEGCGFVFWADVSASDVQSFIFGLGGPEGIGIHTCNFYIQAIKQFCKWMVADQRASESPVNHLKPGNARVDRRHDRRPLETDELRCLLETTCRSATRFGMSGAERARAYRFAAETGLRAGEMRSLTPESFDLDGSPPTVTVQAAYSKNRKQAVVPMRVSLVTELREGLKGKHPDEPVFKLPEKTAKMLRADLEDAGVQYVDSNGRYADFHALRHTFITNLIRSGVQPKVAQGLARHGTIGLTMDRYAHSDAKELSEALESLPNLDSYDRSDRSGEEIAYPSLEEPDMLDMSLSMWEPCSPIGKPLTSVDTQEVENGVGDGGRKDKEMSPLKTSVTPADIDRHGQPPDGLEPTTCGLQNRCSTN